MDIVKLLPYDIVCIIKYYTLKCPHNIDEIKYKCNNIIKYILVDIEGNEYLLFFNKSKRKVTKIKNLNGKITVSIKYYNN